MSQSYEKFAAEKLSYAIDWATVLKPAAVSTSQGYEIWRMDDALQATSPVVLKIEYGSASGGATLPAIWVTLGQGSDGAGTLTGYVTTRVTRGMTAANASTSASIFCGSTSRFTAVIGFGIGTAAGTIVLCIERTRDAAGAETAEGFSFILGGASPASCVFQFVSTVAGLGTLCAAVNVGMPESGSGASGTEIAVYPIFPSKGVYLHPLLSLLGYFVANIGSGSTPTFSYYGENHTYVPLDVRVAAGWLNGTPTGSSLLMLFE